jgi:pimeloyl-ACP methyl ester carboxylesterase
VTIVVGDRAAPAGSSAEPPEEIAHVADQEVGYLHGGEVTAAVELGPVHDVVGLLGEAPDRQALTAGQSAGLAQAASRAEGQSLMGPQRAASGAPQPTSPPGASAPYTDNRADAYYAIQCADSLVPTSDAVYHNLAITEDQQVPGFGRLIVYDMMPCATWPTMHTNAYDGPWNRSRTPILVINAVHDPITPIWGAEAAVDELGNARLLKVNGDGHTSMFVEPSVCRDDAELAYLVSLQLPAKGTTCNVDQLPFGLSPGP